MAAVVHGNGFKQYGGFRVFDSAIGIGNGNNLMKNPISLFFRHGFQPGHKAGGPGTGRGLCPPALRRHYELQEPGPPTHGTNDFANRSDKVRGDSKTIYPER